MACVVLRSSLKAEEVKSIQKHLMLQPKAKMVRGAQGKRIGAAGKAPIRFFEADKTQVWLPHFFSFCLFTSFPNDEKKFPPVSIKFSKSLRPGQEAVMKQVSKDFESYRCSTICAPTGYGKTAMGCYTAAMCGMVTVVLCPMSILLQQWKKSFADFTDAQTWILGEEDMPKKLNVVICLSDRVEKLAEEFRLKVGLLIIDEAHMFCTPSEVKHILSFQPKYILAETATPSRTDEMTVMLSLLCGPNMIEPKYYKKGGKTMMELAGYESEVKPFEVVKVNTGVSVEIKSNKMGNMDWTSLVKDLSDSEERNKCILSICAKEDKAKIIILVARKDHVEFLQKSLEEKEEKIEVLYGKKHSYSNCRILVGTVSKMGTGFDEENLCFEFDGKKADILIICASFRNKSLLAQVAGRIFRSETPRIYHLVDEIKTIQAHWNIAKGFYSSRGAEITELNHGQDEQGEE